MTQLAKGMDPLQPSEPGDDRDIESREALAMLWVKSQNVVAGYIASVIRDSHAADDVLQEVARVAAKKFEEYDRERPFAGWVLGIARFELLRFQRDSARSRVVFSGPLLEELAGDFETADEMADDRREALRACLKSLEGRRRIVLEMRYQRDLQPNEIADRLGVSINAVSVLLHRVRKALGQCIERKTQSSR